MKITLQGLARLGERYGRPFVEAAMQAAAVKNDVAYIPDEEWARLLGKDPKELAQRQRELDSGGCCGH